MDELTPSELKRALANKANGIAQIERARDRPDSYTALFPEEEEQTFYDIETGKTSLVWVRVPRDEHRCRALIKTPLSPWIGNRCRRVKMRGAVVCKAHGGTLPSVRKAAERRLAMAALPAVDRLIYIALQKPGVEDRDRIRAIIEILNRAGLEGKTHIEMEIKPWQQILQRVYRASDPNAEDDGDESDALDLEEGVDFEVLDAD
jgi:hypothetical protein